MIHQRLKTTFRLFFALLLATTGLSLLLSIINLEVQFSNVAAQEPKHTPSYLVNIREETLASIGLTAESIQAASGPTDLEIVKTANVSTVASGSLVTFTVSYTAYFPILFKAPPLPPLVYHEDFSDGDAWLEFDSGGCQTDNRNGQYWADLSSSDRECFPPARDENKPQSPYRTYGEFEVSAYDSGEDKSDASYGLFINGQGGDSYYLFRIWPNNSCSSGGDWELRRRRSGSTITVLSGACHSAIKRGYGGATATNILKITHTNDRKLSLYVNGQLIKTFTDSSSNHLTGKGVGIYLRSDNKHIRVKFDDFKVYKYN